MSLFRTDISKLLFCIRSQKQLFYGLKSVRKMSLFRTQSQKVKMTTICFGQSDDYYIFSRNICFGHISRIKRFVQMFLGALTKNMLLVTRI